MNDKFTQIKNILITLDIHDKSFRILCYLIACSKNRACYPSEYTIANELGISRNKVHECLLELEDKKIIKIEKRILGKGKNNSNKYVINEKYIVTKKDKENLIASLDEDIKADTERAELFDYNWLEDEEE